MKRSKHFILIGASLFTAIPSSHAIIDGQKATKGSSPWIVSILKKRTAQNNTLSHFCSGTLINDEWILTAAHCLYKSGLIDAQGHYKPNNDFYVHLGGTTSVRDIKLNDAIKIKDAHAFFNKNASTLYPLGKFKDYEYIGQNYAKEASLPSEQQRAFLEHDLGLIRINASLDGEPPRQIAHLPSSTEQPNLSSRTLQMSGWGMSGFSTELYNTTDKEQQDVKLLDTANLTSGTRHVLDLQFIDHLSCRARFSLDYTRLLEDNIKPLTQETSLTSVSTVLSQAKAEAPNTEIAYCQKQEEDTISRKQCLKNAGYTAWYIKEFSKQYHWVKALKSEIATGKQRYISSTGHLCADRKNNDYSKPTSTAWFGDSGSPLYDLDSSTVYGVFSISQYYGENKVQLFTNISTYLPWILEKTGMTSK